MEEIINKVAQSGLVEFNLEDYYPKALNELFDIKPYLFHELILREKDFREFIKTHNWSQYQDKNVAICCTADAIVPTWAYLLITTALSGYANKVVFGDISFLVNVLFEEALNKINIADFTDQRVVVKGCSNLDVPVHAYVRITALLAPVAKSIMYGEPCSTVPIYKKAKK